MKIKVRSAGSVSILDITGNITIDSAEIIEVIGNLLNYKKMNILMNLANVQGIDYNGLSILAIAYKSVINHSGRMKFCNVPLHVLSVFKTAHLDAAFRIYDSEKIALGSFTEFISSIDKKALRRRFERLDMRIEVKYSLPARPKKLYSGKFLNISGDGMYIRCKDLFPVNTKVNLSIKLPQTRKAIDVFGIVAWNADREIQPHAYPGMGVRFIDIANDDQEKILEFIDKNTSHRSERK